MVNGDLRISKQKLGFVPPGLEQLSGIWNAPMPDYAFPGGGDSMTVSSSSVHSVRSNRRSSQRWSPVLRRKEDCQRLRFSDSFRICCELKVKRLHNAYDLVPPMWNFFSNNFLGFVIYKKNDILFLFHFNF